MTWLPFIVAAYVLGSIPFGVLLARTRGIDIRQHGSGNIGATNVWRVLGRPLGLTCFALDMAKGAVPVLVAGAWHQDLGYPASDIHPVDMWLWLAVAGAALLGHMASVFLRFQGGKGVATAFGALLSIWPTLGIPALIALTVWIMCMIATRVVSMASMLAAISLPLAVLALMMWNQDSDGQVVMASSQTPPLLVSVLVALLVLVRHRANIKRLLQGGEHRFK
ncbi:MAG: glycerol-3-phosphate 1-O-acyltransferase PlsY [Phycisphaerales bacterium]|nr:glycerol-3-phosphate 1-O-acyltransferase PlsY [Phycisphaerales bacterium]